MQNELGITKILAGPLLIPSRFEQQLPLRAKSPENTAAVSQGFPSIANHIRCPSSYYSDFGCALPTLYMNPQPTRTVETTTYLNKSMEQHRNSGFDQEAMMGFQQDFAAVSSRVFIAFPYCRIFYRSIIPKPLQPELTHSLDPTSLSPQFLDPKLA